jgi:hypothetical protein
VSAQRRLDGDGDLRDTAWFSYKYAGDVAGTSVRHFGPLATREVAIRTNSSTVVTLGAVGDRFCRDARQ